MPSGCAHQFELHGDATVAHLFVEPETRAGRALTARFGAKAVAELPAKPARAAAQALLRALQADLPPGAMAEAAIQVIAELGGGTTTPDPSLAPCFSGARAYIRSHIQDPLSLHEVAMAAALSESRFRHLFACWTGSFKGLADFRPAGICFRRR